MPARKELNMNTFEGRLAARLLELRLAAGLSQDQAAGKIGVKVETIYSWESSRSQPAIVKLPAISDTYGIKMEDILKNL